MYWRRATRLLLPKKHSCEETEKRGERSVREDKGTFGDKGRGDQLARKKGKSAMRFTQEWADYRDAVAGERELARGK